MKRKTNSKKGMEVFPEDSFHILHFTKYENLRGILRKGALMPLSQSEAKPNYPDADAVQTYEDYNNLVFTTLILPIKENESSFYPTEKVEEKRIFFIFSSQLLHRVQPRHFCNEWRYGKFGKGCEIFQKNKSISWNMNHFRKTVPSKTFKNMEYEYVFRYKGFPVANLMNELVFDKPLPLNIPELEYIYVPRKHKDFDKIVDLAYRFPDYPWIFDNPLPPFSLSEKKVKKFEKEDAEMKAIFGKMAEALIKKRKKE